MKKRIETSTREIEEARMMQSELFPGVGLTRTKKGKKEENGVEVREWKVKSSKTDKVYTVRKIGSKWNCTCRRYVENEGKKACKHIRVKKQELGLIKPDIGAYKSAIQKAIRRGDLPLLKFSFSKLWEADRKWLLWRLAILTSEETWQYTGWVGRFAFTENPSREDLWKLLANITLHPKDKDAEGLRLVANSLARHEWKIEDWVEPERTSIVRDWIDIKKNLKLAFKDREKFWSLFVPKNDYSHEIVRACEKRFYQGGMWDDRELLVTVAYFACTEKVEEPVLLDAPKEEEVEPAKEIPWWSLDGHTSTGKIVAYSIKKMFTDKKTADYVASQLRFNMGSAQCDRLVEGSYWWPLALRMWRYARGKTEEEVQKDWAEWQPKIRELVEKVRANQESSKG